MTHRKLTPHQPPRPVHVQGTSKGEEQVVNEGREPGRNLYRPGAYRTARDSTSLNPESKGPIDPRMPNIPPA